MQQTLPHVARVVNGWQMDTDTVGVHGNYYLERAIVAMAGLGANPPEDALYPLNVDDADGFQTANPLGRFAIGDRDPLTSNQDGTLDLHLQHQSPGPDREANWLPAPRGPWA